MGTALSFFAFALGAVLAFAVRSEPAGLDVTAVGVILMIVSAVYFCWSAYRELWRRRIVEESIEGGHGIPPMPLDDTVLVDPSRPIEAPRHVDVLPDDDNQHHGGHSRQPAVNVNIERAGD
jgi:hypothetical protein